MGDERRSAPRAPLIDGISIEVDSLWFFSDDRLSNISETGMFISTDKPFEPETVFDLSVDLGIGDLPPVTAKVEVIWARDAGTDPAQPAGMGVRFLEISNEDVTTIGVVVSKILPQNP